MQASGFVSLWQREFIVYLLLVTSLLFFKKSKDDFRDNLNSILFLVFLEGCEHLLTS